MMKRCMLPAFLCFSFIWTFPVPVSAQLGWLWNWGHRKPITITGSTAGAQTNYQVKVTVGFVAGRMNADFSDIRFTSADGAALLDHWRESYTPSSTADFWVEVPSIPASPSTARIYLYYGNPAAAYAGEYFNTFSVLGDGSGGPLTVAAANTVVNAYTYLTGNENAGDAVIAVNSGAAFSDGDEVLIIQMQNYSGGTAGTYEFRKISSGGGTTSLTLNAPLKNSYTSGTFDSTTATVTQVVRVPQYTNVTLNSGSSITASAWNGYTGGIVVFRASGNIAGEGTINADGMGYRGGADGTWVSWPGDAIGARGESYQGKGITDRFASLGGGGGGQQISSPRNDRGGGGGGGYGTAGANGTTQTTGPPSGDPEYYGRAGASYGSSDLSTIFPGSGGGGSSNGISTEHSGSGGGIVMIYSSIISSSVTVKGADWNSTPATSCEGHSGGAGGSVYVTAPSISSNIDASYGIGQTNGCCGTTGGIGGVGRIRLSGNSITGTSDPAAYTTGFDTEHNRKYVSPEPAAGAPGSEEFGGTFFQLFE